MTAAEGPDLSDYAQKKPRRQPPDDEPTRDPVDPRPATSSRKQLVDPQVNIRVSPETMDQLKALTAALGFRRAAYRDVIEPLIKGAYEKKFPDQ